MADKLNKGDRVEWNTSQGPTTGTVKRKPTSPTTIKGHQVKASKDNPEYLVESENGSPDIAQVGVLDPFFAEKSGRLPTTGPAPGYHGH